MPVFKPDMSKPNGVDESTTQAANAAQLVAEVGAELDTEEPDQPGLEAEPVEEEAAEDEVSDNRGPLQTREAYLKKGEELIRSLL
jgi:hypothetical protein